MLQYRPVEVTCKLLNESKSVLLRVNKSSKSGRKATYLIVMCMPGPMALSVSLSVRNVFFRFPNLQVIHVLHIACMHLL